jgi:hypothetical protein
MSQDVEFTARASLAMVGARFQRWGIWSIVTQHVKIKQKVLKYMPEDKLLDCLLNILCGGNGVVEVNTRVRPDRAVQRAFGRSGCADQSTVSDTLNACTPENVQQLRSAIQVILRQHGQSYGHDYQAEWQVLDVDVTGMPAGRQGEGVTKGYFPKHKNRRGRQLGRVLASWYAEIMVDRLYDGKRQLDRSLRELLLAAEGVLGLDEAKRSRTMVRIDGGGGDDDEVNWVLGRGYGLLVKVKSWRRAAKLAASVWEWYPDPKVSDREVGWPAQPHAYVKETRQLVLRKRKANGTWSYHALVFTVPDALLFQLANEDVPAQPTAATVLFAALHAYDGRGGGVETQNRGDKQGLGLTRRNKRRFAAQEMLVLLAQLAHNLVIWTRNDLAQADPRLQRYGILRTVRDALHIPGQVQFDSRGQVAAVTLNPEHPLALAFQKAFGVTSMGDDLSPILGQN